MIFGCLLCMYSYLKKGVLCFCAQYMSRIFFQATYEKRSIKLLNEYTRFYYNAYIRQTSQ